MLKIFFTTILLITSSCGFHVIYSQDDQNFSHTNDLAAIRIKKDRDRTSQLLKNNLYDFLNPENLSADAKYFLTLHTERAITPTFITLTGASGRNKVILRVSYELQNLETAQVISTGKAMSNDSYDVTTNRYATSIAEESVTANLTKVAAQEIRNSLVNDFIEMRKKCDGKVKVKEDFVCPL
jgi:hypothetical protein